MAIPHGGRGRSGEETFDHAIGCPIVIAGIGIAWIVMLFARGLF